MTAISSFKSTVGAFGVSIAVGWVRSLMSVMILSLMFERAAHAVCAAFVQIDRPGRPGQLAFRRHGPVLIAVGTRANTRVPEDTLSHRERARVQSFRCRVCPDIRAKLEIWFVETSGNSAANLAAGVAAPPFRTSRLGWTNANSPGSSMGAWANPGVAVRADNTAATAMALRNVVRVLAVE